MIDEHGKAASHTPASRRGSLWCGLALLVAVQGGFVAVDAEPLAGTPQSTAGKPAQKTYTLRVTKDGTTDVALDADRAPLSEIAVDLSKRLGARVIVGPSMATETISARFSALSLEQALSSLAPRVYIDYEIRQGAPPAPLGIFLLGLVDPEPAFSAVVRANSQGVLITGNTEDTGKPRRRTIRCGCSTRRVASRSSRSGSRWRPSSWPSRKRWVCRLRSNSSAAEIVDANIKETLLPEEAIRGLSPNVRLYVRVDADPGGENAAAARGRAPRGEVTS